MNHLSMFAFIIYAEVCGILTFPWGKALAEAGYLPPTAPPWPPTYNLARSTISMAVNVSGWSDPERGAQFGIISYDWSNAKRQWALQQPMDCEERLLNQAKMTKSVNQRTKVFVYRNIVKALPWFSSVRRILDDPSYSGFFLKFDPKSKLHVPRCAAENSSKCSSYYHDQEQTPAVPTKEHPHPDGSCPSSSTEHDSGCNCGSQPCGEYLWNHRNGSQLREWLLKEHILSETGLASDSIDGFFIDDYWCSDLICKTNSHIQGCPCHDPVQGPTEIDKNSQLDMGLSDEDIRDITLAWNETMGQVQRAILDANGYTWTLIEKQQNANAMPTLLMKGNCVEQLRAACLGGEDYKFWHENPRLVGLTHSKEQKLTQLEQDVAFFLLVRGKFAWIGWGNWGMGWPFNPEPSHGELPPLPHGVPIPSLLKRDFGKPLSSCRETSPGVFTRKWTKHTVQLNCNNFAADLGKDSDIIVQ
uniref:Uncharacterized protein n=2 Tax=Aplanochytrium stocchinoi TaxID=215587 RepID=A0A7S3LLT8_9STRA|mmetsp:Transcript_14764/g.19101  ORF Transcript_14764/g.19101 Transcript_14764/m.19101 type:complete len:472 (-) Transcript_14764:1-1416(-)|eukprot:CAMPEP_0204860718 /NCGR_PEP_ID=MMETSP1348-20121228/790_1 /ASSEMBLY_ACC=CAM_ASM_000700 /TAXON_ID=215587 /ORGANISM="Aplanochytrium stocchinoi, Strain GSBS06" /LENGTH=471 /DNA_ID=CAMNT_0052009625 /DNA_START=287 /DNA_END=1702 /DNA_ORIENTATION=-